MNKLYILFFSSLTLILCLTSCQSQKEEVTEKQDNSVSKEEVTTDLPLNLIVSIDTIGTLDTISNKFSNTHESFQIYSLDSLVMDVNYYHADDKATNILLCHQARWNKYEYDSIAVVLQQKGYNCLAIDQRSGGIMELVEKQQGPINTTFLRASQAALPTDYLNAEQDIIAAIDYLYNKGNTPIILWGSSYSSTLALYNGLENNKVKAVISFSPGNYFSDEKGSLVPILKKTNKPFFITSSQKEAKAIGELIKGKALANNQIQFIPKMEGYHGSRALWVTKPGNEEYWEAVNNFLEIIK